MAENNLPEFKFPKKLRLLSRYDFERVKSGSRRIHGKYLLLEVSFSSKNTIGGDSRLGITVTRKYGTSPQRNRFKRLCRELFRLSRQNIPQHLDIHIRPKIGNSPLHTLSMGQLQEDFQALLSKMGNLNRHRS